MNNIENGQSAAKQIYIMKDKINLKVHRPSDFGVGSSDPKCWISFLQDKDMVRSISKDIAVKTTQN